MTIESMKMNTNKFRLVIFWFFILQTKLNKLLDQSNKNSKSTFSKFWSSKISLQEH